MSAHYPFADSINLYVKGRIAEQDAERQTRTAKAILQRLQDQPGLILADEVGMGKTFVSLAVAVSVALNDKARRPVVVMVPSSLKEKWPRDFALFKEKCLPPELAAKLECGVAERTVQFLKFLDDPAESRKSIIFLTHGAMSRGLTDDWVKLALIQRAIHRKHNIDHLKRALCRAMGGLLRRRDIDKHHPGLWEDLLSTNSKHWLRVLKRHGLAPEDEDDPVPEMARMALADIDPSEVYEAVQAIPLRKSNYYKQRITEARRAINHVMKDVWRDCIRRVNIQLPLLILDEAHHLKNARTQLASLFQAEDAQADADEISRGPLGGVFERMVFLTATPFQLGHHELCSVLERFEGISWVDGNAPPISENAFREQIKQLHEALNAAQEAGVRLDTAWGTLRQEHILMDGEAPASIDEWWNHVRQREDQVDEVQQVLTRYAQAKDKLQTAEALLRPWVVRHQRAKLLPEPFHDVMRRVRMPGAAILDDKFDKEQGVNEAGIHLAGESLLPFLLAARAAALKPKDRPVFAEGLASSYEAFVFTRLRGEEIDDDKSKETLTDQDDEVCHPHATDEESHWYLDNLEAYIEKDSYQASAAHPKIAATVKRALDLWEQGEKILIFCHYIATGRVLRQHISDAIRARIDALAAIKLNCSIDEALQRLETISDRFFDEETLVRKACDEEIEKILANYEVLDEHRDKLVDVARRFLRTPSFLVRYFPLSEGELTAESVINAFEAKDASGLTVTKLLVDFFDFLQNR